jgi:two-component system response regulator PilR (NtrC family)
VVDDEASMRDMLRIVLRRDGYDVRVAPDGRAAMDVMKREPFDLLLSDIRMPDLSGVEVLRAAKEVNRDIIVFMMTAFASTRTAVEAMRLGAVDYFTKPFNMDELRLKVRQHLESHRLKQENALLKRALHSRHDFSNIIGKQPPDARGIPDGRDDRADRQHRADYRRLGTGKEMVARAVHVNSPRANRPFVALNCGAVPETLLESELSGHLRGAFTGADANRKGLLEVADGGTLFLDEIGEMTATMQVKLLRVLQERRFRRLGGTDEVRTDIRIIAATHQDLPTLVAEGRFREDLFYRINVIPIHLPPLARPPGETFRSAPALPGEVRRQMNKPVSAFRARRSSACGVWVAGQRPRARERDRAVRRARADASHPARHAAGARGRGSIAARSGRR